MKYSPGSLSAIIDVDLTFTHFVPVISSRGGLSAAMEVAQ
jgi:hypothetical protein